MIARVMDGARPPRDWLLGLCLLGAMGCSSSNDGALMQVR